MITPDYTEFKYNTFMTGPVSHRPITPTSHAPVTIGSDHRHFNHASVTVGTSTTTTSV
eukprot:SAG31_NODE_23561_length_501_cov_4.502488_1_plen_57_part_01